MAGVGRKKIRIVPTLGGKHWRRAGSYAGHRSEPAVRPHQHGHRIDLELVLERATKLLKPDALRLIGVLLTLLRTRKFQGGDVLQMMDELVHEH